MSAITVGSLLDVSRCMITDRRGWNRNLFAPGICTHWLHTEQRIHIHPWVVVEAQMKPRFQDETWLTEPLNGIIIRHLHKHRLAWATEYCKGGIWKCCTCREEVPTGILFMARTYKLKGLL